MKNDIEIVMAAVSQNLGAVEYASKEIRENEDLLRIIYKNNCLIIRKYSSKELINDREIGMKVAKESGMALEYLSDELKNDKEIVMTAL